MGKSSFTLEEYEIFLENPFMANFSIDQLNQVIFMHGFNRIWRRPKIDLLNELSTIDLARPHRSTLEDDDYVDGGEVCRWFGAPSTEEVKRDLEALNWPECQVHAVETVGLAPAAAETSSGSARRRRSRKTGGGDSVSVQPMDLLASMASPIRRKRRSRKRKRRFLSSIGGEGNRFHGGRKEREGTADIPSVAAAAVVGAEAAAAESASLYVDTYHWEL